jgi:opacity protein-like surface antigen
MRLAAATLALLAASAAYAEDPRVTLMVDAGLGFQSHSFEATRPIHEFAEDGSLESSYEAGRGPVLGGALQLRFTKKLAVLAGLAISSRDETGTWEARLPHPLYLDRDRIATGDVSDTYEETEIFLAFTLTGSGKKADLRVFAGPAYFASVRAGTVRAVRYAHAYPFDEVTVTDVTQSARDGSGFGFTAGAGADYRIGQRFALGVQGRYSRATVSIAGDDAEPAFDVDAGGFSVTGGLRVRF